MSTVVVMAASVAATWACCTSVSSMSGTSTPASRRASRSLPQLLPRMVDRYSLSGMPVAATAA